MECRCLRYVGGIYIVFSLKNCLAMWETTSVFYLTNLIIYQLSFIVFMKLNIQDLVLKNIQSFFISCFSYMNYYINWHFAYVIQVWTYLFESKRVILNLNISLNIFLYNVQIAKDIKYYIFRFIEWPIKNGRSRLKCHKIKSRK